MDGVRGNVDVTEPSFYDYAYYASMDLRYLNNIHSGRFKALEKILPLIKDKKTLDVGCGGGGLTNVYYSATKDLLGVDFSPDAVNFTKQRYPHLNVRTISVFNLSEIFRPGEFEIVIANDIIEHTYDHDAFLENCKSVLSKQGCLIIGTDLDETPGARYKALKVLRACLLPLGWDGIRFIMLRILELPRDRLKNYHDNHVKTLSQRDLLACLKKHGFKVERILIYNVTRSFLRDSILEIFRWITRLEVRDHQLIVARKI